MTISNEDIAILKIIHGYAQMGHPLTDELQQEAERLKQVGLVKKDKTGLHVIEDNVQWELVQQGITFPSKKHR